MHGADLWPVCTVARGSGNVRRTAGLRGRLEARWHTVPTSAPRSSLATCAVRRLSRKTGAPRWGDGRAATRRGWARYPSSGSFGEVRWVRLLGLVVAWCRRYSGGRRRAGRGSDAFPLHHQRNAAGRFGGNDSAGGRGDTKLEIERAQARTDVDPADLWPRKTISMVRTARPRSRFPPRRRSQHLLSPPHASRPCSLPAHHLP